MKFAKVIRFYGLSFNEVMGLNSFEFSSLYLAIDSLESQEQLLALTAHDWPNMKREQRSKMHKSLYKSAYPSNFDKQKKYITTDQLKGLFSGVK